MSLKRRTLLFSVSSQNLSGSVRPCHGYDSNTAMPIHNQHDRAQAKVRCLYVCMILWIIAKRRRLRILQLFCCFASCCLKRWQAPGAQVQYRHLATAVDTYPAFPGHPDV